MIKTYKESMRLSRQERIDLEYSLLEDDEKLLIFIEEFVLMLVDDVAARITTVGRKKFEEFLRNRVIEIRNEFLQSQYYLKHSLLFTLFLNLRLEEILWDWEDTQK